MEIHLPPCLRSAKIDPGQQPSLQEMARHDAINKWLSQPFTLPGPIEIKLHAPMSFEEKGRLIMACF